MIFLSPGDSQESSPASQFKSINFSVLSLYGLPLTPLHDYRKNHSFDMQTFVGKVISLLFNMLSRFVIAFISRSKCLLISWQQSLFKVILEPRKIKSVTVYIFSSVFSSIFSFLFFHFSSICHEVMGPDAMTSVF